MNDRPIPAAGSVTRPHESQIRPLKQRHFAPFFWRQFLSAMNESVFKIVFASLVMYQVVRLSGVDFKATTLLIAATFILPIVLLSTTIGQIVDKYDKTMLARIVKRFEIAVMLIGGAGVWLHSAPLLYLCIFTMGVYSTMFGVVKVSYLPQHLLMPERVGGNRMVLMGTFAAILIGTVIAGAGAGLVEHGAALLACTCIAIALVGRWAPGFAPLAPASQPDLRINWNPISETWLNLNLARRNRTVCLSLLGIAWLWFVCTGLFLSFFSFAKDALSTHVDIVIVLLGTVSIGKGLGSLLCEKLTRRRVEIGLVPIGSIGMSVFAIDLFFASHALGPAGHLSSVGEFLARPADWRVMADLFLLAMFGGFYSEPLQALIQSRCQPSHRARIVAARNMLNLIFILLSALMARGLSLAGFTLPAIFLVTALLNLLVAFYIRSLVAEHLQRFVARVLVHMAYRIRLVNASGIPEEGAAILVCNHVSFIDMFVILAASPRPIRFVMSHRIYKSRILGGVFRRARAIPIAPAHQDAELLASAYEQCAQAIAYGELVCIFPEGKRTRAGEVHPFRHGVTEIIKRAPAPVIPMALSGLWGSVFSRADDARWPRPIRKGARSRLALAVGEPIDPALATPEMLQQVVTELRGAWM
jgi:1-acyl-sn-glycerol-3-phosphate acyltransferase